LQSTAQQAEQKVEQAAGQVQDRVRQGLDERTSRVGEQINSQASDLRSVAESLREQGKDGPASAAERLADYAERAGHYLDEKDSNAMLADAERLGRRQPWAVGVGGLALGFLASRFLKASSRDRYQGLTVSRPAGVYPASEQGVRAGVPGGSRPGLTREGHEQAVA
jgi:ElaB/YqjD/DUF883 family membrane-anchored ribosome-binding protein